MALTGPEATPLKTAWSFWFDKKTADRKESSEYLGGLKQISNFNTMESFETNFRSLTKPSELPRDHNLFLFRDGCKPMWEEFPDGGCWIIRIKRKGSQLSTNVMWERITNSCVTEVFQTSDVVGCVLSCRLKGDVISLWNESNRDPQSRFRIGEKLKDIFDFDQHTIIQYKEHKESLRDYSTYRNAKNFMFVQSPNVSPALGPSVDATKSPQLGAGMPPSWLPGMSPWSFYASPPTQYQQFGGEGDFEQLVLPPAEFVVEEPSDIHNDKSLKISSKLSADAPEWSPPVRPSAPGGKSPPLSAAAQPFFPGMSPGLSASAQPFYPSQTRCGWSQDTGSCSIPNESAQKTEKPEA